MRFSHSSGDSSTSYQYEDLNLRTIANRIIEECNPLCILEDKMHSSVTLDSFWIQISSERGELESGLDSKLESGSDSDNPRTPLGEETPTP